MGQKVFPKKIIFSTGKTIYSPATKLGQ